VLFISERRATILRAPSAAVLLLGLLALVELGEWAKVRHGWPRPSWWLSGALVTVVLAGTKVIGRAGNTIAVRGLFGVKTVDARHAKIGVATRGVSRYTSVDLDLMTGAHFEPNPVVNRALSIDQFTPGGLEKPMRAARRVASALQLGEPLLAPWLAETSTAPPTPDDRT
jgi:hypothetical protein